MLKIVISELWNLVIDKICNIELIKYTCY